MSDLIKLINATQMRNDIPVLAPGDTVRVHAKVVEGNRERLQVFEGIVIRLRKGGINKNITVRRITHGVGVERTFLVNSPRIDKIEVVRHAKVRRAQLYYLRGLFGKSARLKEKRDDVGTTVTSTKSKRVVATPPDVELTKTGETMVTTPVAIDESVEAAETAPQAPEGELRPATTTEQEVSPSVENTSPTQK